MWDKPQFFHIWDYESRFLTVYAQKFQGFRCARRVASPSPVSCPTRSWHIVVASRTGGSSHGRKSPGISWEKKEGLFIFGFGCFFRGFWMLFGFLGLCFPASLRFLFLFFLLLCFSVCLLLCLSTSTILPFFSSIMCFCCSTSCFFASLLPVFTASLFFSFLLLHFLLFVS